MQREQSDKELWNGIKNNDQSALSLLFERYYFLLVKSRLGYTDNAELAKDAANDMFYNLWRSRQSLSDVENVKAYLLTTFRNQVFALLRRDIKYKDKLQGWQEGQEPVTFSYEQVLINSQVKEEQKEKLRRALSRLTARQKEYLHLKFYEGLSYEQVSEKTGQAVKTIYNTVYEAMKILRQEINL